MMGMAEPPACAPPATKELAYLRHAIDPHPLRPGDKVELSDATFEVVKTTPNGECAGSLIGCGQGVAGLPGCTTLPGEDTQRLKEMDQLILEATLDELLLDEGET